MKTYGNILLASLFLLVQSITFNICAFGQNTWLFQEIATTGRQFPSIHRGSDGRLILTHIESEGSNATIYSTISSTEGQFWEPSRAVGTTRYATMGLQRQPRIITSISGTLHAVWENNRHDVARLAIYHARSTDDGQTWTEATPIDTENIDLNQDFCSIATYRDKVYVTFLSRDKNSIDGLVHVFVTKSTDDGISWSEPRRVDQFPEGGACECCIQKVTVSSTGEVAVAFRSNIANRRDIFVAISGDEGETFNTPLVVQDERWTIFGCPSTGPSIAFDSLGTLHLVWRDSRDSKGTAAVYYSKLIRGAQQGSKNVDISSSLASFAEYSTISVSPDGKNIRILLETSKGLMVSSSIDGGVVFDGDIADALIQRNASPFSIWSPTRGHFYGWQANRPTDHNTVFDIAIGNKPTSVINAVHDDLRVEVKGGWLQVFSHSLPIKQVSVYTLGGDHIASAANGNSSNLLCPLPVGMASQPVLMVIETQNGHIRKILQLIASSTR